jgi:hypothetical protein
MTVNCEDIENLSFNWVEFLISRVRMGYVFCLSLSGFTFSPLATPTLHAKVSAQGHRQDCRQSVIKWRRSASSVHNDGQHFVKLPPEILLLILQHLPLENRIVVGLTCGGLYRKRELKDWAELRTAIRRERRYEWTPELRRYRMAKDCEPLFSGGIEKEITP